MRENVDITNRIPQKAPVLYLFGFISYCVIERFGFYFGLDIQGLLSDFSR